jgi:hypothetical protein
MITQLVRPGCAAILMAGMIMLATGGYQPAHAKDLALEAYGYHLRDVEFDKGNAKYNVTRSGLKASYSHFYFSYDRMDFNWDDIAKLPFGNGQDKPWKALQKIELGAGIEKALNSKWSYALDGAVFSAFENDFGGYGGRVQAWAGYGFSPDLRLRFGARAYIHQFQLIALPVISLDYRLGQQEGFSSSIGVPDAHLRYGFNKYIALRLFGEYEQDLYRLADDSKVEQEGYLQREGVMAGLLMDITPVKDLSITAGVIRSLAYTLTTYNKDGDNEKEYDNEPGWGAIVKVNYTF